MSELIFKREIILSMTRIKTSIKTILDPIFGEADLSFLHAIILIGISQGAINNVSGICRETGMSAGNASTLCKRLENGGLLTRLRGQDDERIVNIKLTEEGVSRVDKIWTLMEPIFQYVDAKDETTKISILTGLSELSNLLELICEDNSTKISNDRKDNSNA